MKREFIDRTTLRANLKSCLDKVSRGEIEYTVYGGYTGCDDYVPNVLITTYRER